MYTLVVFVGEYVKTFLFNFSFSNQNWFKNRITWNQNFSLPYWYPNINPIVSLYGLYLAPFPAAYIFSCQCDPNAKLFGDTIENQKRIERVAYYIYAIITVGHQFCRPKLMRGGYEPARHFYERESCNNPRQSAQDMHNVYIYQFIFV